MQEQCRCSGCAQHIEIAEASRHLLKGACDTIDVSMVYTLPYAEMYFPLIHGLREPSLQMQVGTPPL